MLETIDISALEHFCERSEPEPTDSVPDELVHSFVTPGKATHVKSTIKASKSREMCAVKLLPFFFTKEELTSCNTDGTHGKNALDPTKLKALKGN